MEKFYVRMRIVGGQKSVKFYVSLSGERTQDLAYPDSASGRRMNWLDSLVAGPFDSSSKAEFFMQGIENHITETNR